jgi:3D (Asp-Asp-Asp) domain-containing protein
MIRYFEFLGLWLLCFALIKPLKGETGQAGQATGLSGSHKSGFAATDDWHLATFEVGEPVSKNAPASERHHSNSSAKSSHSTNVAHDSTPDHSTTAAADSSREAHPSVPPTTTETARSATPTVDSPREAHPSVAETTKAPSSHAPASSESSSSSKPTLAHALGHALISTAVAAQKKLDHDGHEIIGRLARLTAYWEGEGDYYTGRGVSATGIHLHGGHCAVDPSIIPYGSVVDIPGVGQFLAVDTGSAVISREAAREGGRTRAERSALVIDLFFEHPRDGERFAAEAPKFVPISWWTPSSTSHAAMAARSVFADEDWNKIYNKQL